MLEFLVALRINLPKRGKITSRRTIFQLFRPVGGFSPTTLNEARGQKAHGKPTTSSESGDIQIRVLVNLQPRTKREDQRVLLNFYLEQSVNVRGLGQSSTSSKARGLKGLDKPTVSIKARGFTSRIGFRWQINQDFFKLIARLRSVRHFLTLSYWT